MPTILLTGGAGFLGSHVADELISQGHEVTILDDLSGGYYRNIPPGAEFVQGSMCDEALVNDLFDRGGFSFVFHFAAYAAEGYSHHIRRFNYTNNLLGSINLVNAALRHDVKRFVYASSIAVYGRIPAPFSEDAPTLPVDPYGVAKLAVEHDLRAAHEYFGLPYVIFRPHNVYGERQNLADPYRNVVGIFMRQVLRGEPCTISGNGTQTRAFSYVGDIAPLIARSVTTPGAGNRVINIGSEEIVTVAELAKLVQDALGRKTGVKHLEARKEAHAVYADHRRSTAIFGQTPKTSLRNGLLRMASWAGGLEIADRHDFPPEEVSKNLPPSWNSRHIEPEHKTP